MPRKQTATAAASDNYLIHSAAQDPLERYPTGNVDANKASAKISWNSGMHADSDILSIHHQPGSLSNMRGEVDYTIARQARGIPPEVRAAAHTWTDYELEWYKERAAAIPPYMRRPPELRLRGGGGEDDDDDNDNPQQQSGLGSGERGTADVILVQSARRSAERGTIDNPRGQSAESSTERGTAGTPSVHSARGSADCNAADVPPIHSARGSADRVPAGIPPVHMAIWTWKGFL